MKHMTENELRRLWLEALDKDALATAARIEQELQRRVIRVEVRDAA